MSSQSTEKVVLELPRPSALVMMIDSGLMPMDTLFAPPSLLETSVTSGLPQSKRKEALVLGKMFQLASTDIPLMVALVLTKMISNFQLVLHTPGKMP